VHNASTSVVYWVKLEHLCVSDHSFAQLMSEHTYAFRTIVMVLLHPRSLHFYPKTSVEAPNRAVASRKSLTGS
jgi:hypothetical protein